ncbi:MAG: helix-turn-helix transcriptional regulator [Terriglobales bacterium]
MNASAKFGQNVRKLRAELHVSQEKLAEFCGLHRTYIGSVERGERNVSLQNIVRISRALQTTPSTLLEGIK